MVKSSKYFIATILTLLLSVFAASSISAATVLSWHSTLHFDGWNQPVSHEEFYVPKGSRVTLKVDQYVIADRDGSADRSVNAKVTYKFYNIENNFSVEATKTFHGNYGGAFGDPGKETFYLPEGRYQVSASTHDTHNYGIAIGGNVYVSK